VVVMVVVMVVVVVVVVVVVCFVTGLFCLAILPLNHC